ncbi:MAG: hypothetical protein IJ895_00890 [Prevotella sp.]|nr:hypothetical protein [Prevotella sp.]
MTRTKTTELMDMVYDKLMNNTSYKQFEPEMAEEAELVYNANTGEAEYISMTIDGITYTLTITPTFKGQA